MDTGWVPLPHSQSPAVPDVQPAQLSQGLQHPSFPLKAPSSPSASLTWGHSLELGEFLQNHSTEEPRHQFVFSSIPYKSDLSHLILLFLRSLQF